MRNSVSLLIQMNKESRGFTPSLASDGVDLFCVFAHTPGIVIDIYWIWLPLPKSRKAS